MKMSYEDEIEEYADQWDNAQAGGSRLPEGVYQARIKVSRVEFSDRFETWQLFIVFEDMGGAGEQPMWYDLQHEVGAALAKRITRDLGWEGAEEPGALKQLKAVCEEGFFLDTVCEIRVKDKPGEERVFKQVFINRVLGKAAPDTASSGTPVADDDIPF